MSTPSTQLVAAPVGIAIVRAAVAPLQAEPRAASPQVSQRLAGHPMYVLEAGEEWLRVRGLDDYEGWVHRGYLMHLPQHGVVVPTGPDDEFALTYVPRVSLGTRVSSPRGGPRALPLGAWLDLDEEVEEGAALPLNALPARFPATPDAVIQSATTLFAGTRYEWGGITPWGADCSGFVQAVFALHGVPLPRDAWQQAVAGEAAAASLSEHHPGELLFFSDRADRRITHVGIALGKGRMAHLALGRGGFAVEQLLDPADAYAAKLATRFVTARRVL
jgi:hypothetical protein